MMKSYPDWRFNFHEDWHIIKMKDIISRVSREVEKPNKPYYKLSVRSHAKGTFHQYISDPKSVDMENLYVVHKNDLIVNITFAWEHAIAVANESDEGLLVSHRFPTYIIDKADVNFVKYRVSLKDFKYKLDIISPGGAGRNRVMNQADFNEIKIKIPCIEEQKKIANCLTHFNKALTAQEKKVTNWREVKNGMLQKIFSREFRFKDDNGNEYPDWQEKFIGDICKIQTGSGNTQDKNDDGIYNFYVRSQIVEKSNKYIFDGEAVLTAGDGVGVGKVYHYFNGKFNCHQRVYYMTDFKNVIGKYFYYYFLTNFYKRVKKMTAKNSVDSVRMDMISKMPIKFPCLEEQKKIADYFSHLDKIISAESKILESMREMKKGLLQKLFV